MSNNPRKTIAAPVLISGIEFHTGKNAIVRLTPAKSDTGVRLRLKNSSISASIENLGLSHKSTTSIALPGKTISTTEHLLSALFGLGITDIYIEMVKGTEIPILDGSARPWIQAINDVGIKVLAGTAARLQLSQEVTYTHGISEYHLKPSTDLTIDLEINFPDTIIGTQRYSYIHSSNTYTEDIAWARTFIGDGANGGKLNRNKILSRLKSVDINKPESCPCILYEQMNYITALRHKNEPAAHKLLDFIGDLSLLGGELCADITVKRPSHQGNHLLVKKLIEDNLVLS